MKNTFFLYLLLLSTGVFGQTFYVEPTEKGFEKKISEKLDFAGIKLSPEKTGSKYTISYHFQQNRKNYKYEAYIKVVETESGKDVYRTPVEKKAANAFNGYQAVPAIISKLTEKDLLPALQKGL